MLQLIGNDRAANARIATSSHDLVGYWTRQRRLLLVPAAAFSTWRRRLQLGHLGGSGSVGPSQSLCSTRTVVSAASCDLWSALRVDKARNCRRCFLRIQFSSAGAWLVAQRLSFSACILGLSLLVRFDGRPVDAAHHGQRLLSIPAAHNFGQATTGSSGIPYARAPPRHRRLHDCHSRKSGRDALVAYALDRSVGALQPLCPAPGVAWTAVIARAFALSRSRRHTVAASGVHAAALVLRWISALADSQNAPRNCLDGFFQLGRGHLALVPHTPQLA